MKEAIRRLLSVDRRKRKEKMSIIKEIWKEYKGNKYKFELGVLAKNVETDASHQFLTLQEKEGMMSKDTPINNTVQFTKAASRENIVNGETISKIMGKICKVIGDLLSAGTGFRGTTDAINQGTDADVVSRKALKSVDDKLGGVSFEREGKDIYAVYKNGADTVRKKLGNGGMTYQNAVIHSIHRERVKNLEIEESEEWTRYGNMSVFDLTALPGYKDFIFGENIIAVALSIEQEQGSGFRGMMGILPHKKLQHNINAPIDDNVTVRNFLDPGGEYTPQFNQNDEEDYWKVITEYEPGNIKTEYIGDREILRNMALYCPINGKLYCACFNTSTIIEVSLYKI